jgi:hypothetical protein
MFLSNLKFFRQFFMPYSSYAVCEVASHLALDFAYQQDKGVLPQSQKIGYRTYTPEISSSLADFSVHKLGTFSVDLLEFSPVPSVGLDTDRIQVVMCLHSKGVGGRTDCFYSTVLLPEPNSLDNRYKYKVCTAMRVGFNRRARRLQRVANLFAREFVSSYYSYKLR